MKVVMAKLGTPERDEAERAYLKATGRLMMLIRERRRREGGDND
jgi:hypothetical protein